jgi:hypothetical protein
LTPRGAAAARTVAVQIPRALAVVVGAARDFPQVPWDPPPFPAFVAGQGRLIDTVCGRLGPTCGSGGSRERPAASRSTRLRVVLQPGPQHEPSASALSLTSRRLPQDHRDRSLPRLALAGADNDRTGA